MLVLNKSRDLLDFLREFQTEEALQRSEALQGAHSSCGRVESLMEILQDRRRQVDQHMKQQLLDLEVILSIYQWDRQEQEVSHEMSISKINPCYKSTFYLKPLPTLYASRHKCSVA